MKGMEQSILSKIGSWEKRSFLRGYVELRELEEVGFSGSIEVGASWLFMLNGKIVGIDNGEIEDFDAKEGTVYVAPHPSLPLLFSMQSSIKEKGIRYYTEDKSIEEIDATLREAEFTGYLELSENVLSGDYYIIYHRGRSMNVAFIGNVNRLITDEEAQDGTKEEVGIYEVNVGGIKTISIPKGKGAEDLHQKIIVTENRVEEQIIKEGVAEIEIAFEEEPHPEISSKNPQREVTIRIDKGNRFKGEEEWRESRIIPSIDPTQDGDMVTVIKREREKKDKGTNVEERGDTLEKVVENLSTPKVQKTTPSKVDQETQLIEEEVIQKIVNEEFAKEKSNIFIRYKKDEGPTLLKSLEGRKPIGQISVETNLKYEIHSRFDTDRTLVKGKRGTEEVKEYIRKTPEYRFAKWIYLKLPYEIKGTKNIKLLRSLYKAIPKIDRIQLRGSVETMGKDGDSRRYKFDIVMVDVEGKPLIVANVNDDLDPTGGEMVTELVETASKVAECEDTFVAAFLVSSSYHSKEAREVAAEKIKGKRRSRKGDSKIKDPRIKVSRKDKYHLGLVDCREGEEVHLVFPEL